MLGYKEIRLLIALENRESFRDQETCFDYVDSICREGSNWAVSVFVEPVGILTVRGEDLANVLSFWISLFQSQPEDWGFAKSGWHLEHHLETFYWKHPEDAQDVWKKESI
jgi:hypothetical protein